MRLTLLAALTAVVASGCSVNKTEPPPAAGPSELSTSISLAANPDVLPQDGVSQSQITIQARDANGQAIRSLPLRVEISINGVVQDFGQLSSKNVVTGNDGRTQVTYTAPQSVDSVDRNTTITLLATPAGADARNQNSRTVDIRLVPPGVITPPGPRVPDFTINPAAPEALDQVTFNATDATLDNLITAYEWNFGDGSTASGRIVQHQFRSAGNYAVTLTVADTTGARASRPKSVPVSQGTAPTASFVYSPTAPGIGQDVFFNASQSVAAPTRSIVSYKWDFGTGRTGTGVTVSRRFDTPGTYRVTLVVTDDAGVTGSTTSDVTVSETGTGAPVARFTFSPTSPTAGAQVNFNASTSTAARGIASYTWEWGDGTSQVTTGNTTVGHTFAAAGSYVVTLRVRDNAGTEATTSQPVSVQ